jgi:hypothetical protein
MLICFAIGIGIVKEETNHIVESKGVEIKKNRERGKKKSCLLHVMKNYITSITRKDKDVETILGTLKKTVFGGNKSLHAPLKYDNASYMLVPA